MALVEAAHEMAIAEVLRGDTTTLVGVANVTGASLVRAVAEAGADEVKPEAVADTSIK